MDAGSCIGAGLVFQIVAPDPTAWFVEDFASPKWDECDQQVWLHVYDASGADLMLTHCCAYATCETCMLPDTVDVCGLPMDFPPPATRTWDGTIYVESTCGATVEGCVSQRCAPAGSYRAEMCAWRNVDQSHVCVDVPFVLPATGGAIVGTLPQ